MMMLCVHVYNTISARVYYSIIHYYMNGLLLLVCVNAREIGPAGTCATVLSDQTQTHSRPR